MKLRTVLALGLVAASLFAAPVTDVRAQGVGLSQTSTQAAPRASSLSQGAFFADPNQIANFLRGRGYAAEVTTDSDGDPTIRTRSQGVTWNVLFYGCQGGRNCNAITFESTYEPNAQSGLDNLNAWSVSKRYAYAVRRNDGIVALRMDVLMIGGISEQLFQESHGLWETQLGAFLRHIRF